MRNSVGLTRNLTFVIEALHSTPKSHAVGIVFLGNDEIVLDKTGENFIVIIGKGHVLAPGNTKSIVSSGTHATIFLMDNHNTIVGRCELITNRPGCVS